MKRLALAVLAATGFAWTPAVAAISPTGVADTDTAAIQQAIDDAPNGTVALASGKFALNKAITISNGASLVGVGGAPEDVVLSLATQTKDDGDWNVLDINGSANTVVSNLTVTTGAARTDNGFGPKSGIAMNSGLVVDCVVRDCRTRNNAYAGGGVNMTGGTLRRCLVAGCNALDSGGGGMAGEGIYMTGGFVENCTVVSNGITSAGYMGGSGSGGAVYVRGGVLRGCLVANNRNRVGGSGVTVRDGATVESCTIVGNRQNIADANAYGVDVSGNNVVLRNNIIWDNTAFDGAVANVRFASTSGYTFEYNDTRPLLDGNGNISADPEFVNAANGDYRIGYSYCSDAGDNQTWMQGACDLDGNDRIRNSVVDMGCCEGTPPVGFAVRMCLTSDEASDLARVEVMYDCSGGTATSDAWTFTRRQDGAQVGANGFRSSVQLPTGTWDVHLVVYGSGSARAEKTGLVVVQSSRAYANVNGAGVFPYDTVEKGLPSITEALKTVGVGGTLYVAEGSYVITNGIRLADGACARIESLGGPERTVVRLANVATFDDDGGEFGLSLECDTAYACGLTFIAGINGPYYNGDEYKSRGFAKVRANGAVVTNCVFRDLRGRDRKWGCGLDISAGTVVDCLFTHINSFSSGGAMPQGGGFCIQGGLVDRTRIVECHALDSGSSATGAGGQGDIVGVWGTGVLRNSLVARCTSQHDTPVYVGASSGASVGGHLENCTIVANTNLQATAKNGFWYAAGIVVNGGSVTNCIVVDNWSTYGNAVSNIYNTAGAAGIGYTLANDRAGDATFVTAENRNVAVQPGVRVFRKPEKGDYSLATGSPAINVGLKFDWMETALDLVGSPRIISRAPDMGCCEARPSRFCIRLR